MSAVDPRLHQASIDAELTPHVPRVAGGASEQERPFERREQMVGGCTWTTRVTGLRCNASTLSHAELDDAEDLDEGELDVLVAAHRALEAAFPNLSVVGGCCGTDIRHVAALWGVQPSR